MVIGGTQSGNLYFTDGRSFFQNSACAFDGAKSLPGFDFFLRPITKAIVEIWSAMLTPTICHAFEESRATVGTNIRNGGQRFLINETDIVAIYLLAVDTNSIGYVNNSPTYWLPH